LGFIISVIIVTIVPIVVNLWYWLVFKQGEKSRYLLAPKDKKKRIARDLKVIAIIWLVAAVVIYLGVLIVRFIVKS